MPDGENISVAKIAATPTASSWSQAYNAGKLFAVISLSKEASEEDWKDFLNILGKDVIETLEQEFFGLETKDLTSIKKAFEEASKKIPEEVEASFLASSIVKDIIYVFHKGEARVSLKRGGEFGVLIDSKEEIGASSGMIKNDDILILQTQQFKELVPSSVLTKALDQESPSDVAEALAPLIHREEKGGAAAIILQYKAKQEEAVPQTMDEKEMEDEKQESSSASKFNLPAFIAKLSSLIKVPSLKKISHSRKLILTIIIIIAALFLVIVVLSVKNQNEAKNKAFFESIYKPSVEKFKEGESLLTLNKNLARDNFSEAYKILNENRDKFPKNSKEEKQILELLEKTQKALGESSGVSKIEAKEEKEDASPLLQTVNKTNTNYISQDDKNIYFIKKGVVSHDKGNNKEKTIIEEEDLPTSIGGLSGYNGNVYVLDKEENQIYKFAGADYSKSNYFKSPPDLSSAKTIAIDGSIWILLNGSIEKFTKGISDNFNITRLDNPLSAPTRIFTDANTDNVYILDNGNSRIVVLNKSGEYQAQYQTDILKNAKDFEVKEKDLPAGRQGEIIYILSGGKIYSIKLQ